MLYRKEDDSEDGKGREKIKAFICSECHMVLPIQFVNDVHRMDSIMFCPYCSRILFFDDKINDQFKNADISEGESFGVFADSGDDEDDISAVDEFGENTENIQPEDNPVFGDDDDAVFDDEEAEEENELLNEEGAEFGETPDEFDENSEDDEEMSYGDDHEDDSMSSDEGDDEDDDEDDLSSDDDEDDE